MAASTASMCLRRESLSVHVHISSHDCSRFNGLLSVDRLQVSGIRFQVVAGGGTFGCTHDSASLCYMRTVFFETRRPSFPDTCSLIPETYPPSYETLMTP